MGGIPQSLKGCYVWSIIGDLCSIVWLAVIWQHNVVTYVPYALSVYLKLIFGLSYQKSVIELKYQINLFFEQEENFSIDKFTKKVNRMRYGIMFCQLLIVIVAILDISLNWFRYYILQNSKQDLGDSPFFKSTLWAVCCFFLFLVFNLCYQTILILRRINVMGQSL